MRINYNESLLTFDSLRTNLVDDISIIEDHENGQIFIAGAATRSEVEEGPFGTLKFTREGITGDSTQIVLTNLRWNEGVIQTAVASVDLDLTSMKEQSDRFPEKFNLMQNYPNPFNPTTIITFGLPESTPVSITIFDIHGHQVKKVYYPMKDTGWHSVKWDGRSNSGIAVSAGVYFYRIQAQQFEEVKKMVLIK